MADIQVINIEEKFSKFREQLSYKIIAQLNDYQFKLVRSYGDFVWHNHPETDEAFIVIDGDFQIDLRNRTLHMTRGDMVIIPRGIEHKPYAERECKILLIEPEGTINTGNAGGELTRTDTEWI
jgi:mannose-6-phosphate isomerase-like protein (cupin superfamily)